MTTMTIAMTKRMTTGGVAFGPTAFYRAAQKGKLHNHEESAVYHVLILHCHDKIQNLIELFKRDFPERNKESNTCEFH